MAYNTRVRIYSQIRYGDWEYKFGFLSLLSVIYFVIDFLQGSYGSLLLIVPFQTILLQTFGERISQKTGLCLCVLLTVCYLSAFVFVGCSLLDFSIALFYSLVSILVLLFSDSIDSVQELVQRNSGSRY